MSRLAKIKPLLYALADALGIEFHVTNGKKLSGTVKRTLDLFEGYSPTVCVDIERSLISYSWGVVIAQLQLWANLGVVATAESRTGLVTLFIVNRKELDDIMLFDESWSRRRLYEYLQHACKAVYYRRLYETEWSKLENGPQKLRDYTTFRQQNMPSKEAYETVWGGIA